MVRLLLLDHLQDKLFVEVGIVFTGNCCVCQIEPAAECRQLPLAAAEEHGTVSGEAPGKAEQFIGSVEQFSFPVFAD